MEVRSPCEPIGPLALAVVDAAHDWYGAIWERMRRETIDAAQVVMGWQSRFRPIAWPLAGEPTQAQIESGEAFQGSDHPPDGDWWMLAPELDERRPELSLAEGIGSEGARRIASSRGRGYAITSRNVTLSSSRGGGFLIVDRQVVQDATAVVRSPTGDDQLERFIGNLVPRSRGESPSTPDTYSRKARESPASTRALVLALLSPRVGQRAGARLLLRWDEELAVDDRDPTARHKLAMLAERYERGDLTADFGPRPLLDEDADALDTAEVAIIDSATRTWTALGIGTDPPCSRAGE